MTDRLQIAEYRDRYETKHSFGQGYFKNRGEPVSNDAFRFWTRCSRAEEAAQTASQLPVAARTVAGVYAGRVLHAGDHPHAGSQEAKELAVVVGLSG